MKNNKKIQTHEQPSYRKHIFLILSIVAVIAILFVSSITVPKMPVNLLGTSKPQIIYVDKNTTVDEFGDELQQKHIIRSADEFTDRITQIKANNAEDNGANNQMVDEGNYLLSPSWSLNKNIDAMSQPNSDAVKRQYFKNVAADAVKAGHKYHILPSLIMAHSGLESNYGTSTLSAKYNNYFGIKTTIKSRGVKLPTKEYVNNKEVTTYAYFLKVPSREKAFEIYAKTLCQGNQWNHKQFQDVVNAKNYHDAAQALYKDHYSTDPDIGTKVEYLIARFHLDKYDK